MGRRMTDLDPALWRRLSAHPLDQAKAEFPFSRRLARENGWSSGFTRRAIEEYRRFCYLAMVAGHEVTPSDAIDQVWHLHLQYTRDYWHEFCPSVLGRSLHHQPTRGGASERSRYRANYRATLASYRRHFGAPPPADLWPDEQTRFADAQHVRRVNARHSLIIPLPAPLLRLAMAAAFLLVTGGALLAIPHSRAGDAADAPGSIDTPLLSTIVLIVAVVVALIWRRLAQRTRRGNISDSSGCGGGGGTWSDSSDNDSSDNDSSGGDSGCGGGCGGGD